MSLRESCIITKFREKDSTGKDKNPPRTNFWTFPGEVSNYVVPLFTLCSNRNLHRCIEGCLLTMGVKGEGKSRRYFPLHQNFASITYENFEHMF